jgi:hypothetical protein
MEDAACTACHGNLTGHRRPGAGSLTVAAAVTRFDSKSHPDFAATSATSSAKTARIKFNHARHLATGLTMVAGGTAFTFADLDPADRARYGLTAGQRLDTPVQLECATCHELDGALRAGGLGRRIAALAAPRSPGDYMLPVSYENDCRACHPLQFDPKVADLQVRHGVAPAVVVEELKRLYSAEALKHDPALLQRFVARAPVPGPAIPAEERVEQAIAEKVFAAGKLLFGAGIDEVARRRDHLPIGRRGCFECHALKPSPSPPLSIAALSSLEIEPVRTDSISFEHARFDHTAHRVLECAACHAGASISTENPDPNLLPAIAQCVTCHAPATSSARGPRGGASIACIECHRYHNGDHPAEGAGATARRPRSRMSVERFVSGAPPPRER